MARIALPAAGWGSGRGANVGSGALGRARSKLPLGMLVEVVRVQELWAALLAAKSPALAKRVVTAQLLALNLVCTLRCQVAQERGLEPWGLNLSGLRARVAACPTVGLPAADYPAWLSAVTARDRISHRPGRAEPRAMKRRATSCPALARPRAVLRAELQGGR